MALTCVPGAGAPGALCVASRRPEVRLRALHVPQDGEHAPVALAVRAEAELLEDAGHVALDATLGDAEPRGDRAVGEALGHQRHDLALARGEPGERVVVRA